MRWRKLGSIWYTSKTSRIPIKLLHNAATTVCSMRLWVISIMIITIQLQKVSEISVAMMGMMGLDLAEKATLMRNHSQRGFIDSEDLWLIQRILVKRKFFTSVSHHLSCYYYNLQVIILGHILAFFQNFNFKALCFPRIIRELSKT